VAASKGLYLGDHSDVGGSAQAGGEIAPGWRSTVRGDQRGGSLVRSHDISWWKDLDVAGVALYIDAGEELEITPGSYSSVIVAPGGTLRLAPGVYEIGELLIGERGMLTVDASQDTTLHVDSDLSIAGTVTSYFGQTPSSRLLIAYFGTTDGAVSGAFSGRVTAPNARLVLGDTSQATLSGAFFAQDIEVLPGSTIRYLAN
jgi:hypothetical protein